MFARCCFILAALAAVCSAAPGKAVAGRQGASSDVCNQWAANRNRKDLYPDATNCHNYIQCFFINETYAVAFTRTCPAGQFWHDSVLTCMGEGSKPCTDACLDDATAAKGCYAGAGCRQFFVCANTGSFGMCCPAGTAFNAATCACDESETCTDSCVQAGPAVATTVKPATSVNSTVCIDSFGTSISAIAGESNAYALNDADGQATVKQYCPNGVSFDLGTCSCSVENGAAAPPPVQRPQATLWINFDDGTAADKSVNKFTTFLVNGAQVDSSVGRSGSSLFVNGGYLSIPGLKNHDYRQAASYCASFRCESGSGYACSSAGAIFSNAQSSTEYTVVAGVQSSNSFTGKLNFWQPVGTQTASGSFTVPSNGWNNFCLTYNGNAVKLYVNGKTVDSENVGGFLILPPSYNFLVGSDVSLGTFTGHIDDILVADFALGNDDIAAYSQYNFAALSAKGYF